MPILNSGSGRDDPTRKAGKVVKVGGAACLNNYSLTNLGHWGTRESENPLICIDMDLDESSYPVCIQDINHTESTSFLALCSLSNRNANRCQKFKSAQIARACKAGRVA